MHNKRYIGVDLHTDNFTACYFTPPDEHKTEKYPLDSEGLESFRSNIKRGDKIAVEATSNSVFFYNQIRRKVRTITFVAPSQFVIICKSTQKTDRNDAYKLAYFLSKGMLPKARLKKEVYRQLDSYLDTRTLLVKTRRALLQKSHTILHRNGIKLAKSSLSAKSAFDRHIFSRKWRLHTRIELQTIHNQIKSVTTDIKRLEKHIDGLARQIHGYENLLSISGLGPISAATILAAIGDIDDFKKAKNLCSYFGIVPKIRQSNDTLRAGRITKAGAKNGRTALAQSTWTTIRYSPYFKEYYERIKARGHSKKALIACSRKLLTIIFYTLKNDWIFDDFPAYRYHIRGKEKEAD